MASVLFCYAATIAHVQREREKDTLQHLSVITVCYAILWDFNGRVGPWIENDKRWGVKGAQMVIGDLNDAGRELLSFLRIYEAMGCRTRFEKMAIYKQIWQHQSDYEESQPLDMFVSF